MLNIYMISVQVITRNDARRICGMQSIVNADAQIVFNFVFIQTRFLVSSDIKTNLHMCALANISDLGEIEI